MPTSVSSKKFKFANSPSKMRSRKGKIVPDDRKSKKIKLVKTNLPKLEETNLNCCCDAKIINTVIPCQLNTAAVNDVASMAFKCLNAKTGLIPLTGDVTPGVLIYYLRDVIAHYQYILGDWADTAPFDMGGFVVFPGLAVWLAESFAPVIIKGTTKGYRRKLVNFNNASVTSFIFSEAGNYQTRVMDGGSLVAGEPVFGTGVNLTLSVARSYYDVLSQKFAAAWKCVAVRDLPMYTRCGYLLGNNSGYFVRPPPSFDTLAGCDTLLPVGFYARSSIRNYPPSYERQIAIGSYFDLVNRVEWKKSMTFYKAISTLGWANPQDFVIAPLRITLSKARSLIAAVFNTMGLSALSVGDQNLMATLFCAWTSFLINRMPNYGIYNYTNWHVNPWCDFPVPPCLAEIGTAARRADSYWCVPYLAVTSVNYSSGAPLMSLIQPSLVMVPNSDEMFDAFPVNFTWTGSLQVFGSVPPAGNSGLNFTPVFVVGEALSYVANHNFIPMPKIRRVPPMSTAFVFSRNVTIIGATFAYYGSGPVDYTCYAACTHKESCTNQAMNLICERIVGTYVGSADDSSAESHNVAARACIINNANVVATGSLDNNPQKTYTRSFYNQFIPKMTGTEAVVTADQLIGLARMWLSEGGEIGPITQTGFVNLVATNPWVSTLVAGAASLVYTFPQAANFLRELREYQVLIPN